jgi:uncharacterized membrane protein YhaH (DUF805 family)
MNFFQALKTFYRRYFDVDGRSIRSEYWWVQFLNLGLIAVSFLAAFLLGFDFYKGEADEFLPYLPFILLALYFLTHFVGLITLAVRRFHDIGQTGWFVLIFAAVGIIPLIGLFAYVIQFAMLAMPGTEGPNKYGPDMTTARPSTEHL